MFSALVRIVSPCATLSKLCVVLLSQCLFAGRRLKQQIYSNLDCVFVAAKVSDSHRMWEEAVCEYVRLLDSLLYKIGWSMLEDNLA